MRQSIDRIAAVALKELRQLRRDRLTFGMIVGIPMLQMLLFGYAINFDVRGLDAGVADLANTSMSRALAADLQATGTLRITEHVRSAGELRERLRSGAISIGLYIPPDFERRRIERDRPIAQLLVDGSKPTVENIARGLSALALSNRAGVYAPRTSLLEVRTEYNPEKRTAVQIVPALIGVILSMTMMIFTAVAIVRERERGNLELLITTPTSSLELMVGKILPYIGIGLIQTTLVLALGSLLFHVPINGGLFDLYAASLLFIAATLSLGLLISTLAETQMQAFQIAFFLLLPSILLSGFMFPFEGMPQFAQWLAQLLPLTHFIVLIRGIVLRGAGLGELQLPIYKLLGFVIAMLSLVTLRFRKRLD
ncbi:MAG TPA: ABC transporter permease [Steroidobacteraceae bacterium]|nr:ABC transporter permease [Steroidobacteraceae bacterium]